MSFRMKYYRRSTRLQRLLLNIPIPLKTKSLLTQVSDLEASLHSFSFEELSAEEAARLQKSFLLFKRHLEARIWGEVTRPEPVRNEEPAPEPGKPDHKKDVALIATVSHEMRTPLNGIIGFADLLMEGRLSEEQQCQVQAIQAASNGLLNIINELLEYAKISAGLEHFDSVPFNIHNLVREVTYLCKTLILDKRITLETRVDPGIPEYLKGDPSKLSQILLNLLGNAVKFVEKGCISLQIDQIKEQGGSCTLQFTISDTGAGISEADLEHIFSSFRQAGQHPFQIHGGTGLGLSIVKQVIDKLGGQIAVKSALGKGTTFTFYLPYQKSDGPRNAVPAPKLEQKKNTLKGIRVLVFEDNALNQKVIGERLNSWGAFCHITTNPFEGIRLLEQHKVDLVLMDLHMPVMDGFELSRRIRSHHNPERRVVPIIALSADFTAADRDRCRDAGIDEFILKPFRPEELHSRILKHCRPENEKELVLPSSLNHGVDMSIPRPAIDLSPLLEDCLGKVALLEDLVKLYKQNALEFIGRVRVCLQKTDFKGIAFASHKIKCSIKMFRTESLLELVEQMHKTSRTNQDIKQLKFLHKCFLEEYPLVEAALDEALLKLKKE